MCSTAQAALVWHFGISPIGTRTVLGNTGPDSHHGVVPLHSGSLTAPPMHKYPSILGNDFDPTPSAIWMHPVRRTPSRMHTCKESLDHADPEEYLEGLDGVGPKTAKRIVDGLGPFAEMADIREALSGAEEDVVKSLTKLPGIRQAVALRVKRAWDERQGELLCWCPCCARGCVPGVPW